MDSINHLNHNDNPDPSVKTNPNENQSVTFSYSDRSTFHLREGLETAFNHLNISELGPTSMDDVSASASEQLVLGGQNHAHRHAYNSVARRLNLWNVNGYSNQNQIMSRHQNSGQTSSGNRPPRGIFLWATNPNQYGSLLIQIDLELLNFDMIVADLEGHMYELMVDQFGTRVVQKLFESIKDDHNMHRLVHSVLSDLKNFQMVCIDQNGNKAVLKMMENLRNFEHKIIFSAAINRSIDMLTSCFLGHAVIRRCFKLFLRFYNKVLIHGIAKKCLYLATNQVGCYILKSCIEYADGPIKDYLMNQISENAVTLSLHAYGNYVVKSVLELRIPRVTENVVERLGERFKELCMDKYGSHVVETCFKHCEEQQIAAIILKICQNQDFKMIIMDDYGNYVVQTAIRVSKGMHRSLHKYLVGKIRCFAESLKSHPRGKLVLKAAEGQKNRYCV